MIINMNGAKAPETPSPVLQEKTVTPETLPTVIGADEGYDGLSQVTVNPDPQLKAENIRSGRTIFGVTGIFEGASSVENPVVTAMKNRDTEAWLGRYKGKGVKITSEDLKDFGKGCNVNYNGSNTYDFVLSDYMFYRCPVNEIDLTGLTFPWGKHALQNLTVDIDAYDNIEEACVKVKGLGNAGFPEYSPVIDYFLSNCLIADFPEWSYQSLSGDFLSGASTIREELIIPEGVKYLGYGALDEVSFKQYTRQNGGWIVSYYPGRFVLPSTVTQMDRIPTASNSTFTIVMKATTPPTLRYDNPSYRKQPVKIVVPAGCLTAYQTATNWSQYADIMEEATE